MKVNYFEYNLEKMRVLNNLINGNITLNKGTMY